jgi:RNA polymerase sigma-70 factor, ECF subfamily
MADEDLDNLVARWQQGDQEAAAELFRQYAGRLIGLARSQLSHKLSRHVDAEDIVQSVYRSFFADLRNGSYDIRRGTDLWRLLVTITLRKLQHQVERFTAAKRTVQREHSLDGEKSLDDLRPRLRGEPTPLEAAALADELEQLMRQLTPEQRPILELRLLGHRHQAIAAKLGCSDRTVRRVLDKVKQLLAQSRD